MRTYTQAEVDEISDSQYRLGIRHAEARHRLDGVGQKLRVLAEDMERQCATLHGHASKQVAPTSQSGGAMVHAAPHINGYETRVAMHSPNARHTVTPPIGRSRWAVPAGSVAGRVLTLVTTWFR